MWSIARLAVLLCSKYGCPHSQGHYLSELGCQCATNLCGASSITLRMSSGQRNRKSGKSTMQAHNKTAADITVVDEVQNCKSHMKNYSHQQSSKTLQHQKSSEVITPNADVNEFVTQQNKSSTSKTGSLSKQCASSILSRSSPELITLDSDSSDSSVMSVVHTSTPTGCGSPMSNDGKLSKTVMSGVVNQVDEQKHGVECSGPRVEERLRGDGKEINSFSSMDRDTCISTRGGCQKKNVCDGQSSSGNKRKRTLSDEAAARSAKADTEHEGSLQLPDDGQHKQSDTTEPTADESNSLGKVTAEEQLAKLRKWLPASNYGFRAPGDGVPLTVVSYNVLSQYLLETMPDLYRDTEPRHTRWSARLPRVWQQIMALRPDIVCLQEVDADTVDTCWKPLCDKEGFSILYKRRTSFSSGGQKRDGCALLVRAGRWRPVHVASVEYRQPAGGAALDRDNVGLVARLRSGESEVTVACTHLLYNPKREDVRLAQTALLLAELDRVAWCGRTRTHTPLIVAGDFNMAPSSAVYEFVTRGRLHYDGLFRRTLRPYGEGARLQAPLLPAPLGVSHCCRHVGIVRRRRRDAGVDADAPPETEERRRAEEERLVRLAHSERAGGRDGEPPPEYDASLESAGWLEHGFSLQSAYLHRDGGQWEVTTKQRGWTNVDYIFHSRPGPTVCGRLELQAVLRLPSAALCDRLQPWPSAQLPSDHLHVAARYQLCPATAGDAAADARQPGPWRRRYRRWQDDGGQAAAPPPQPAWPPSWLLQLQRRQAAAVGVRLAGGGNSLLGAGPRCDAGGGWEAGAGPRSDAVDRWQQRGPQRCWAAAGSWSWVKYS